MLRVWDRQSGREQSSQPCSQQRPSETSLDWDFHTSIATTADGRRVVSGSTDGVVRVWDTTMGLETIQLRGHAKRVNHVVFSAAGRLLISVSDDGTARIWDASGP